MKEKWLAFYKSKYFLPVCVILYLTIATFIIVKIMDAFNLWAALAMLVLLILVIKILASLLGMVLSIFK